MARVRPAAYAALLLVLLVAATATAVIPRSTPRALAAVAWPPSTGLLVAEVVTGGASASDEYVELANAGSVPADLSGLEVAYATSSGATVTKKASWTAPLMLAPGQHLLLANASGIYASIADAVYTTGLAASGGAVVLRATGGAVVDAVGWGDATNSFVEGAVVAAPAAGQSIERLPGGGANAADTNNNGADFVLNASPVPQNLSAAPLPSPTGSPSPVPSASTSPSPSASGSDTPAPSLTASPGESATPSADPTGSASPSLDASPTPAPTATPPATVEPTPSPVPTSSASPSPTPSATPQPTPSPQPTATGSAGPTPSASPTPSPMPAPVAIGAVRGLPDGTSATIEGALTTALGALESGRTGFVQDLTGGMALYLDAAYAAPIPAGALIRATGTVASRYGQRSLRISGADVVVVAMAGLPAPLEVSTGGALEALEGLRLHVTGTVTGATSSLADGLGVTVDDGSGPLRIVVAPGALNGATVSTGMVVSVVGPLGQRDSGGTDASGYRLFATLSGEFEIAPWPSPSPSQSSPSPTPTPSPTASPSPTPSTSPSPSPAPSVTPSPTAKPTPTPTAKPRVMTVGEARNLAVGGAALVRGVVTADAGRLGTPSLFAIGDETGGLPVRLADGMSAPPRGTLVEALGVIAAPYGQTELRLASNGLTSIGTAALPTAQDAAAGSIGEALEGRLVRVTGTITTSAAKSTSDDLVLVLTGADGASVRVYADASAGLNAGAFKKGMAGGFAGIVGQHASKKGALDGYRIWLRDAADVTASASSSASPGPTPTPSAGATSSGTAAVESIATARLRDGATVTVQGVVTVDRTLLDATGRLTVVEDGSAAIELSLPAAEASIHIGANVRVTGVIGKAWGAPRLRADKVTVLGSATPAVLDLHTGPGAATEWRLVRVSGTVTSVHRTGDRWVAELDANGGTIPIVALAGAGIPASAIAAGHSVTIVGIVKRPYPTATDRRYAILPRQASDVRLGAAAAAVRSGSGGSPADGSTPGSGRSDHAASGAPAVVAAPVADLRDLAVRVGQRTQVSGIVTETTADGFRLDDGTATAMIVLEGMAADLLAVIGQGDALDATGVVEQRGGTVVVVRDPADVVLVGDLGVQADASGWTAGAGEIVLDSAAPAMTLAHGVASEGQASGTGMVLAALAILVAAAALGARRMRDKRRLRARIHARLAALANAAGARWPSEPETQDSASAAQTGLADG